MNKDINQLKVAIVAEELTQLGGAERVLDAILEIFPKAPIYTLVWDKVKTQHKYDKFDVRPSCIQKMPFGIKKYKWFLPFMPLAIEKFDLSEFDLVISSSSALIKGVKTGKNQIHICYCHTPTRYLWGETKDYLKTAPIPAIAKPLMPLVIWFLRKWDLKASKRPDFYIANAENIKNKIKKYYNRDSVVIYPPVETDRFKIGKTIGDYYLITSRIEPYKKVDLVVEAFNQLGLKLKVVGSGTKKDEIQKMAKANIEFTGRISDEELVDAYQNCIAYLFPQEEDFGIVPVEAMSAGRPVIAYKKGGALETVIEGKTGEYFYPQTVEALVKTIQNFDVNKYNPQEIRNHALKFSKEVFKTKLLEYINSIKQV
ncbi:MAG: glycosyltransferase [Candidatus Berkelbacteria bacterium]